MNTKQRIEKVLQILADVERVGSFSDIERDIVLNELREAYAEVRFADKVELTAVAEPVAAPVAAEVAVAEENLSTEEDEPEVEIELIFNEDEDDEAEDEVETEVEDEVEPEVEPEEEPIPEPIVEPSVAEDRVVEGDEPAEPAESETVEPAVEENIPKEEVAEEELQIIPPKSQGRSAILSLYDDEPQPVLGEQFATEQPSVADTIAPTRGVVDATPVESLRSAIGVVDRFMLIRELFDGDSDAYNAAIDALDSQTSFDDCLIYIAEHFSWRADREGTKFMMELLNRRFN